MSADEVAEKSEEKDPSAEENRPGNTSMTDDPTKPLATSKHTEIDVGPSEFTSIDIPSSPGEQVEMEDISAKRHSPLSDTLTTQQKLNGKLPKIKPNNSNEPLIDEQKTNKHVLNVSPSAESAPLITEESKSEPLNVKILLQTLSTQPFRSEKQNGNRISDESTAASISSDDNLRQLCDDIQSLDNTDRPNIICFAQCTTPSQRSILQSKFSDGYNIIHSNYNRPLFPRESYHPFVALSVAAALIFLVCFATFYMSRYESSIFIIAVIIALFLFALALISLPRVFLFVMSISSAIAASMFNRQFDHIGLSVVISKAISNKAECVVSSPFDKQGYEFPSCWPNHLKIWFHTWFKACFARAGFMFLRCDNGLFVMAAAMSDGTTNTKRINQSRQLAKTLNRYVFDMQTPVILCLNGNSPNDKPEMQFIEHSMKFNDVWTECNGNQPGDTFCESNELAQKRKNECNPIESVEFGRLDYIWYRGIGSEAKSAELWHDSKPNKSDHFGVLSSIFIPPPPPIENENKTSAVVSE